MQANLKKRLSEQNMTAAELERRTGIPHAVVNILHGRSKNPSLKTAQAIAKELGCSVEDLFAEPGSAVTNNSNVWQPEIYQHSFNAVYQSILKLQLRPNAAQVSECITEVYQYTVGSPTKSVDQRFVEWLLKKNIVE